MKRNPRLEEIYPIWPLFAWRRCCSCGQEFRREKGWYKTVFFGREHTKYICFDCACNKTEALEIFDKHSF